MSMNTRAVLLACGADRPGVLDEISSFLLERGVNIIDNRGINLHGAFATRMPLSSAALQE